MNKDLISAYEKYNKDISREVSFTLFDKNFLIEVFNHNKELERQIDEIRNHVLELDTRIKELETGGI